MEFLPRPIGDDEPLKDEGLVSKPARVVRRTKMTDPKAMLPDDVEADIIWLADYARSQGDEPPEQLERLTAHIAAQAEANAKLEAEKNRLREACEIALGHMAGGLDGNYADCDPVEKLRAALAQTEGEK